MTAPQRFFCGNAAPAKASGRDLRIYIAEKQAEFEDVSTLIREYQSLLDVDIGFQGVDEELATLPGKYRPPDGALLIARDDGDRAIGCVGMRPFPRSGACEMKRLFVRAEGRGTGVGRALALEAIAFAARAGYCEILLDSLPSMTAAIKLYRSLGFVRIEPYWNNTLPGILYFGKRLID